MQPLYTLRKTDPEYNNKQQSYLVDILPDMVEGAGVLTLSLVQVLQDVLCYGGFQLSKN
jgi:hypothetical protein